MRRLLALVTSLAIALSALIATPAQAVVLSDGTYSCSTGLPSAATPNFTVTGGVVSLGSNCSGSLVLPEGVTTVGVSAFENSGVTSISFPASIFIIEASAFRNASSVTSITFPAGLGDIGDGAFQGAASLQNVYFEGTEAPSSANNAFGSLPNQATAHILANATGFGPSGGTWNGLIVSRAFQAGMMSDGTFDCNTGVRQTTASSPNITVEGATVIENPDCLGAVIIPSGVTAIDAYAFTNGALTSIDLPSSLRTIGFAAFRNTDDLVSVNMRSGVTSIGGQAFQNADSLVEIIIPATVTSIGANVFAFTDSLESVTFAGGITSVPSETFLDAQALETVTLPNSVTSIGVEAFAGTAALQSVTMPSSLTSIGDQAFEDSGLPSINIPGSVISIGYRAFKDTYSLTSLTLNSGLDTIGDYAFAGAGLTSVVIPSSVTQIGEGAFAGASALHAITIPNGITTIQQATFAGTSSITSVTIPSSVTTIEDFAFEDAPLASIYFLGNAPTTVGNMAFNNVPNTAKVLIQPGATGFGSTWNGFTVASATADGYYACSTGAPAVSGQRFLITNRVLVNAVDCVGAVVIPPGITSIDDGAFQAAAVSEILVPASLATVSADALRVPSLMSMQVAPNNAAFSSIDGVLFNAARTTLLTYPAAKPGASYSVPASVLTIGNLAFLGAGSLSTVSFAGNAPTVGINAFGGVAGSAQAVVGDSATGFGAAGSVWNGLIISISTSQNQNNNQQNNNQVVATPVTKVGPVFNFSTRASVSANGGSFTLKGANLADVRSATVAGKVAKISVNASGELNIEIPAGTEANPDVVIVHIGGNIILQGFVKVLKPYTEKRTQKIAGLSGSAPSKSALAALQKSYLAGTPANVVSCVATVASNASAKGIALAKKLAKSTCQSMVEFSSFIDTVDVQVLKTGRAGSKPSLAVTFDRTLDGM